jgi:hypothetical protein
MTPVAALAGAWLAAVWAPPAAPSVAREPRGEVVIDADQAPRPVDDAKYPVHGMARVGLGFGAVMEDPVAVVHPSLQLDFSELSPVRLRFGAPIRFRLIARAPDQRGVVRNADWDEAGDAVAVLEQLDYADQFVVGRAGHAAVDLHSGRLRGVGFGHRSLVRQYDNSLDVDRRRTGVDLRTEVEGKLLGQVASFEAGLLVGDLAGSQILGARAAGRWAGAGVGLTAVGDPNAPRDLQQTAAPDPRFTRGRGGTLVPEGRRGVAGVSVDVSYLATDRWWWRVEPYLDLVALPGLGRGLHLGVDGDVTLGRRRRLQLGAVAELTVSDRNYDPAYFDVFYVAERWLVPPVAVPDDRPDDHTTVAASKWGFVERENLAGAGGYGALRLRHAQGVFAETGYQMRPGPRGHTWYLHGGLQLAAVELSLLVANRGRHGFVLKRAGALAELDARVPVLKWMDVFGALGWLSAIRADPTAPPGGEATGLVTGAGYVVAGVGGRVPW